jgi:hypothetical protein
MNCPAQQSTETDPAKISPKAVEKNRRNEARTEAKRQGEIVNGILQ